jgi:hypothetical protein
MALRSALGLCVDLVLAKACCSLFAAEDRDGCPTLRSALRAFETGSADQGAAGGKVQENGTNQRRMKSVLHVAVEMSTSGIYAGCLFDCAW